MPNFWMSISLFEYSLQEQRLIFEKLKNNNKLANMAFEKWLNNGRVSFVFWWLLFGCIAWRFEILLLWTGLKGNIIKVFTFLTDFGLFFLKFLDNFGVKVAKYRSIRRAILLKYLFFFSRSDFFRKISRTHQIFQENKKYYKNTYKFSRRGNMY